MRSRFLIAAALIGVAGCGSNGSSTSSHRAAVPGSGSRPTQVYRVHVTGATGAPRGAAHATGAAVIAFHGDSRVCWRFAHLHGFTDATSAVIQSGTKGRTEQVVIALSPGPRLHHQGCVPVSSALSRRIWARPGGYYVTIHSKQYPTGAVRAQL